MESFTKEGFKIPRLNFLWLRIKCAVDKSQKLQSGLKSKRRLERKGQTPCFPHFSRKYRVVVRDGCRPARPMRKRFLALQKTYPGESFFIVKLLYCVLASLPRSETRVLSVAGGGDEVFCRQDKLDSVARVSKARTPRPELKYRRHKYGKVHVAENG